MKTLLDIVKSVQERPSLYFGDKQSLDVMWAFLLGCDCVASQYVTDSKKSLLEFISWYQKKEGIGSEGDIFTCLRKDVRENDAVSRFLSAYAEYLSEEKR